MTEQATVFGRMVLGQRIDTVRAVAVITEFFRLFFVHGHKPFMVIVMWQPGSCFRWCAPEEQEKTHTEYEEKQVVDQYFLFAVNFFVHPIPLGVLA